MTGQLPGCRADPQRQAAGCVPVQLHQRPLAPVTVLARDRAHDRAYCLKIFSLNEKIYARYAAGYHLAPLHDAGVQLQRLAHPPPEPAAQPHVLAGAAPGVTLQRHPACKQIIVDMSVECR